MSAMSLDLRDEWLEDGVARVVAMLVVLLLSSVSPERLLATSLGVGEATRSRCALDVIRPGQPTRGGSQNVTMLLNAWTEPGVAECRWGLLLVGRVGTMTGVTMLGSCNLSNVIEIDYGVKKVLTIL